MKGMIYAGAMVAGGVLLAWVIASSGPKQRREDDDIGFIPNSAEAAKCPPGYYFRHQNGYGVIWCRRGEHP